MLMPHAILYACYVCCYDAMLALCCCFFDDVDAIRRYIFATTLLCQRQRRCYACLRCLPSHRCYHVVTAGGEDGYSTEHVAHITDSHHGHGIRNTPILRYHGHRMSGDMERHGISRYAAPSFNIGTRSAIGYRQERRWPRQDNVWQRGGVTLLQRCYYADEARV